MSEKSFAVGSVAVAVIWGAFFYPPPPPQRALPGIKASAAPAATATRTPRKDARLAQAAPRPAGAPERRWWRRNLLELKSSRAHP
jgi:hypothetical protein